MDKEGKKKKIFIFDIKTTDSKKTVGLFYSAMICESGKKPVNISS